MSERRHLSLYWILSTFPPEMARDMCMVNGISYIEAIRELELYETRDIERYMPFYEINEDGPEE